MNIVITHINPDFDAVASAYAAYKLYNCDHIALCSNMENNVFKFIKDNEFSINIKQYNDKTYKEITKIDNLIITDCNQTARLGKLACLIDLADNIIIYDHHNKSSCDIETDNKNIQEIGAVTSLMVEILKKENINISKEEATFLALGIYEDTGLLTFSKTKEIDALSLAYLISKKADTTSANDYIQRELSNIQVMLLNELLLNLSIITVGGVDVAYSFATIDDYVDEAALITHKLMAIEGLSSLFTLISTGGRLVLIGRSNDERVNVLSIVSQFGGGGHSVAGSAIIKDKMIAETLEMLKYVIRETVKPVKTIQEIMTTHVKYVESNAILKDAVDLTMKFNLNYMPVIENNKTIGIISRKDILHGVKHGLEYESINNIMQTEFETVHPETPFYEAEAIMVYENQKLLPVENNKGIVGVVTRTDLLRLMHEDIILQSKYADKKRSQFGILKNRNVNSLVQDNLDKHILSILKNIGALAEELNYKAYVVGGFVRDLLMDKKNFDIDIVIEGDGTKFASAYAKKYGGKVFIHQKFKTAVVTMEDGFKIDFATARTEYYITPAAAPEVVESSVKSDLFRRDFTINAMAVRLDGNQFGNLLDFFMGQKDIQDKKIRVLHSLSIVDDPSRALRAIRFAVRFGFEIGSHTERLLKHAQSLDLYNRIIGSRKFLELKYILQEENYLQALQLLNKYNILKIYSSKIKYDDELAAKFKRGENLYNWYKIQFEKDLEIWRVRFNILFFTIKGEAYTKFIDNFDIPLKQSVLLKNDHKYMEYANGLFKRYKEHKPSFIYGVCSNLTDESALALAAVMGESKQDIIKDYLTEYKNIKISLNGNDLLNLGVKKGPDVRKYLDMLLKARLDNIVTSKEDEINFIKNECGVKI